MSLPWWLDRIVWVVEIKIRKHWVAHDCATTRQQARVMSRMARLKGHTARVHKYLPMDRFG